MKLILCPRCDDVVRLRQYRRACDCGASWGQYTTPLMAHYGGEAIPLTMGNRSMVRAVSRVRHYPDPERGERIDTNVVAETCRTFRRVE